MQFTSAGIREMTVEEYRHGFHYVDEEVPFESKIEYKQEKLNLRGEKYD